MKTLDEYMAELDYDEQFYAACEDYVERELESSDHPDTDDFFEYVHKNAFAEEDEEGHQVLNAPTYQEYLESKEEIE